MNWTLTENTLKKTFEFEDFTAAIAWMVKAAFVVEKLNHHPVWTNIYNHVEVNLCTHDAGNIVTDKDYQLAAALDEI